MAILIWKINSTESEFEIDVKWHENRNKPKDL